MYVLFSSQNTHTHTLPPKNQTQHPPTPLPPNTHTPTKNQHTPIHPQTPTPPQQHPPPKNQAQTQTTPTHTPTTTTTRCGAACGPSARPSGPCWPCRPSPCWRPPRWRCLSPTSRRRRSAPYCSARVSRLGGRGCVMYIHVYHTKGSVGGCYDMYTVLLHIFIDLMRASRSAGWLG